MARPLAPDRTRCAPDLTVDLERQLHMRGVGELVDERAGLALHAWRLAVERERDGVQDRRLAGADRSDDADQPPAAEVDRHLVAVGAEPAERQLTRSH